MQEEGYSVLITDATVVLKPGKYLKGYVYLNKGKIVAVGEGDPPSEYSYAMYLINGKNRIVMPGLICPLISISTYPSRFGGKEASSFEELYSASQMAIQELLLSGVTTFGTVEEIVDPVARAIASTGTGSIIFVDADKEGWKKQLELLLNKWHGFENRIYAGIYREKGNEEQKGIAERLKLPMLSPDTGVQFLEVPNISGDRGVVKIVKGNIMSYGFKRGAPTVNPLNVLRALYYMGHEAIDIFRALTTNASLLLNLQGIGSIESGNYADITIFDVSEPPGWTAGQGIPEEVLIVTNPKVETVIVNGDVVVDSFQPLTIGTKDVKRARQLFGER